MSICGSAAWARPAPTRPQTTDHLRMHTPPDPPTMKDVTTPGYRSRGGFAGSTRTTMDFVTGVLLVSAVASSAASTLVSG